MLYLTGKRALVVGVANDPSIAWAAARALRRAGAKLAVTYLNEKAETYVRPLAERLTAPIFMPRDVERSDYGAQKVVDTYNLMGPVKLEMAAFLASDSARKIAGSVVCVDAGRHIVG